MDPFNLSARVDETNKRRLARIYAEVYQEVYDRSGSIQEAKDAALSAVLDSVSGPRTDLAPVREDAPQIFSREGKQFAVVGKGWIMQPVGDVTAREAELICRQALSGGLAAPYQGSPPSAPTAAQSSLDAAAVRAQNGLRWWLENCDSFRAESGNGPVPDETHALEGMVKVGDLRALAQVDFPRSSVPRPAPTHSEDPLWTAASTLEAEVRRIAGDYIPDHPNESGAALYQMRAALELALATRADAELCQDEGCPNAAEPHVCVSTAGETRRDYVNMGTRSGRLTAVNPGAAPSTEQRNSLVETVRHVLDLLGRDTGVVTFRVAEQALVTYLARWPAADRPPAPGRTIGTVVDRVTLAAAAHRCAVQNAPISSATEDVEFDAMVRAMTVMEEMTPSERDGVLRERSELVALRAEAKELKAYLRAFVSATIDPHRRDMGEFLANPFVTYEFSHVDEDDTPEGYTITGGQVRRAAELVGYDVLRVAPPESTIAAELTEARDLRLEVKTMREKLAQSDGALKKLLELRKPDEARKAAEADPVAAMDLPLVLADDEYLIVSVKHTKEPNITFWSPNRRGYTTDLRCVGKYTMEEVYNATDPERVGPDRSFPVPSSVIWDALGRRFDLILAPVRLLPVLEAAARVVLRAYADTNPRPPAPTEES